MLHLQRFLRGFDSQGMAFTELREKFAIKTTQHLQHPNLWLFKYDQVESPFAEPLVRECRGIILDADNDWAVVSMPYTKFFNYGESLAADIDWSTATAFEKLDGSLMTMYHYKGQWHVSTSGVPDATCRVGDFGLTFGELFWRTFRLEGLDLSEFDEDHCYMFELCAPENRVVVRHADTRLYLHGWRHIPTLQERNILDACTSGMRIAPWYRLNTVDACLEAAKHLNPLEHEGYVVCDAGFNRIKIKSPAYVALHHSKDGLMSRRKVALLIREGESEEFKTALDAFPELRADFERLELAYHFLVQAAEQGFEALKHIEDQKEFALAAKEAYPKVMSFLFAMRKHGLTPQAYMKTITEPAYLRMLGVKESKETVAV